MRYRAGGNEEEDLQRGQVKAQQRNMRLPSGETALQILRLDNINTSSACQSQGFLHKTFFHFYPSQPIYSESSRLHAAHIRVISTLTLEVSAARKA